VTEQIPLADFFREHGSTAKEDFLALFNGAFLLIREQQSPPVAVRLGREEGFKLVIGSDEDVDLPFEMDQTMDAEHVTIAYHPGFRGWTVEDHDTSFGTHIGEERLVKGRPTLLQDRQLLKPGGGLVEMQLYLAETLWRRMNTAGVTSRRRKKKKKKA